MKKILIGTLVVISSIIMTGCTSKVEKIETKNEKTNKDVLEVVSNKETIESLQLLDDNILMTSLGLSIDDVEDYVGKIPVYNIPDANMYVAIKPKKGKEDVVERALKLYTDDLQQKLSETKIDEKTGEQKIIETEASKQVKNMLKKEYKGYYIYISSKNNDKIFNILKKRI